MDMNAGTEFVPAAKQSSAKSQTIGYCLTVRDWGQSLTNNRIPLDHPLLVRLYKLVNEFNAAGPVRITSVEAPGGAQPQNDVICGRDPLQSLRSLDSKLDKNVEARILVRGPYGVGLEALHPDDLSVVLRSLADSAGARSGRRVVFKLFEAQNVPEEYATTMRILSAMRREGYNVACEAAICYTADEAFDEDYYLNAGRKITRIAEKIDPEILERLTFKDMTGYANADTDRIEEGSASAMARILMQIAGEYRARTGRVLETGLHTHNTNFAESANVAASETVNDAVRTKGLAATSAFVVDVMPGKSAFGDMREVMTQNAEKGAGLSPSERQLAILGEMEGIVQDLESFYAYTMKADNKIWKREQLLHARLPSGAKVDAFNKAVLPAAKILQETAGISESEAIRAVADMFPHVNRWLAHQNGNASSVTPGAIRLYTLANVVLVSMVTSGHYQELRDRGVDFTQLTGRDPATGKKTEAAWINELWRHVDAIASSPDPDVSKAREYFRSRMPFEIHETLMVIYARAHLEKVLSDPALAGTLAFVPESERHNVRAQLLSEPSNKTHALKVLTAAGCSHEKATAFVREHVGLMELLRDENRPSVLSNVTTYINELKAKIAGGRLMIRNLSAQFALITMGGADRKQFSGDATRLCVEGTSDINPGAWAANFVDWWKLTQRWTAGAANDNDLASRLGARLTFFLNNIKNPAVRARLTKQVQQGAVINCSDAMYPSAGLSQAVSTVPCDDGNLVVVDFSTAERRARLEALRRYLCHRRGTAVAASVPRVA